MWLCWERVCGESLNSVNLSELREKAKLGDKKAQDEAMEISE